MKAILTIFVFAFLQVLCFGHSSFPRHYEDIECIFEGFGDENFWSLCRDLSSGLDKTIVDDFTKTGGVIPGGMGNHRILGHGWPLNGDIPSSVLKELDKAKPGQSKFFIEIWRKHCSYIQEKAMEMTGLPRKQAWALASLIEDIHLLGDLEPDNVRVEHVLECRKIIANFNKNVDILFGKNTKFAKNVHKMLAKYKMKGLPPQVAAEGAMGELYKLDFGDMLNKGYGKYLKTVYSPDRAASASRKIANRPLTKIPGITKLESTAQSLHGAKNATFVRGVLQEHTINGKTVQTLSVPISTALNAGIKAGVLTLIFAEGKTIYSFANGNISEEEFLQETTKNCGESIVAGTTVFVLVAVGFNPGGWVVLGAGVAADLIYEISFDYICSEFEIKNLTLDDILGRLPTEIQRRKTFFDPVGRQTFFDCNKQHESLLLPRVQQRETFFDVGTKDSFFDEKNKAPKLGL